MREQTLGGYGYMEDYPFEKRLRDMSTLKSLHGALDQLKLFLNELARKKQENVECFAAGPLPIC